MASNERKFTVLQILAIHYDAKVNIFLGNLVWPCRDLGCTGQCKGRQCGQVYMKIV